MTIRQTRGDRAFSLINGLLLAIVTIVTAYPIIWVVSSSISDPYAQLAGKVTLLPVGLDFSAYRVVFSHPEILPAYWNTIKYTALSIVISTTLSALCAYPLSRRHFFGRKFFTAVLMITMFFSGGMVPTFLQVRNLSLINTVWGVVLPGALSVYNTIVMRTFFQASIPDELEESAFLDGANDLQFFVRIVLPLSKAILVVMVLFYGVAMWNNWFNAFLYTSSRKMYPLQNILREIVLQPEPGGVSGRPLRWRGGPAAGLHQRGKYPEPDAPDGGVPLHRAGVYRAGRQHLLPAAV